MRWFNDDLKASFSVSLTNICYFFKSIYKESAASLEVMMTDWPLIIVPYEAALFICLYHYSWIKTGTAP
ncbi:hypothetical protein LBYZC6_01620 [Lacrimispora brassicae]